MVVSIVHFNPINMNACQSAEMGDYWPFFFSIFSGEGNLGALATCQPVSRLQQGNKDLSLILLCTNSA